VSNNDKQKFVTLCEEALYNATIDYNMPRIEVFE